MKSRLRTTDLYCCTLLLVGAGLSFEDASGQSLQETGSTLPIVLIETEGQTIPDEPKITVNMTIVYRGAGERTYPDDALEPGYVAYRGAVGIERRGSSTQWIPGWKPQYGVETRDAEGRNLNVSLLGLPEENDWILHGPYLDKTALRNAFVYGLARSVGRYASRTVYCEVMLDGQYLGLFVLMEKIKRDNNRVDLAELDADDVQGDSLTGGYIIKVDKLTGGDTRAWHSSLSGTNYIFHDPQPEDIRPEQGAYIQRYVTEFEQVVYGRLCQPARGLPAFHP